MVSGTSEILVDPEDRWLLDEYSWSISSDGYAITNVYAGYYKQRTVLMHHCIVGQPIWEGEEIDHINRVRLDNRRCNLRYVDGSTQALNRTHKPGVLGAKNIYETAEGKYRVRIKRHQVDYYLGQFDTLDEAVAERDMWLWHNSMR
jgi:hypothetical protein